ncbi:NADP-dependent oxidoreductase domain-containing protein [Ilyonectria robusta]|uniref:NADP-dependent oxidoreductase domain-containing protein n=1 Tax=Ilyonectria robusta TaxID=1079257 RepID=UPI001E8CDFC3|nr:NADP-dependent oxidoreductase domain-containing protein [Ilyonectria robusta]KAH8688258.1 NADP-dependent oxidoreductase domain-containing protein [Ilyonectria robusta]
MALPFAPPPKSALARYRLLSPSAAVRVSPLCLGTMNFGDAWKGYMGECDQATTESILDFYYDQVGNFLDTANNYQFQESEKRIGEWMKKRDNRDEMVIATKYTINFNGGPHEKNIMSNFTGNGTKSMFVSIRNSLKNLQTDYVDILYVHWWDYSTSIPELMQALNQLVISGKVLYLGISDSPAWVVAKANAYARQHGLRPFSVYQGLWSASKRDFEREIIPMCKDEGMGIAPWGALGGGKFKTEEQRKVKDGRQVEATEAEIKASKVLESIANRKNTIITSIALAYVMHKTPYVFPIVGGRKVDHLKGNIEALNISLSDEDIQEIDNAVEFDLGFPHSFLVQPGQSNGTQDVWLLKMGGTFDYVSDKKPISPAKEVKEEVKE